jgi:hypothetical protein
MSSCHRLGHVAKTAKELCKLSVVMQDAANSYLQYGLQAVGEAAGAAAARMHAAALATVPQWSPEQKEQLQQLCEHVQRFLPVFFDQLQEGGEG